KPGKEPSLHDDDYLAVAALAHTDAFVRDRARARQVLSALYKDDFGKTYVTALAVMALEPLGGSAHAARITQAVQGPLAGQTCGRHAGGWSYGGVVKAPRLEPPALEVADPVIEVVGGVAIATSGARTTLEAPSLTNKAEPDDSCSQFAVLGLHSAA